jgi:alpha,alpha-trehalase
LGESIAGSLQVGCRNADGGSYDYSWTNGVLLWVASNYGEVLNAPVCPDLILSAEAGTTTASGSGASGTSPSHKKSAAEPLGAVGGGKWAAMVLAGLIAGAAVL